MPSDRAPGAFRSPTAPVLLVTAVGLVCVLAAALGGPWRVDATKFGGAFGTPPAAQNAPTSSMAPPRPIPPAAPLPSWVGVAIWVVLVVVLALVCWWVWRRLPRRHRRSEDRVLLATAATAEAGPSAPVVQSGLALAAELLERGGDPTDAVIQAWLALEEAAERSGVPRRRADTPTEFTGRVLTSTPADGDAVEQLLHLYHRARFSSAGVATADLGAARACVRTLADSWSRFAQPDANDADTDTAARTDPAGTR